MALLPALPLFISLTLALPTPQDAEDIPSGGIGYDPSAQGDQIAGNDGGDTGAVTLSKGAIIAISIVAFVVVVGGVSLATLFYISKRRQWRLAETLRRSVKRVGTGLSRVMTPRTPHKMTFSPILSSSEKQRNKNRNGSSTVLIDEQDRLQSPDRSGNGNGNGRKERGGERTAEKGLSTVNEENRNSSPSSQRSSSNSNSQEAKSGRKSKRPPPPPPVTVPQSKFEMDSPKTPLWSKVFGR